MQNRRDFLLAIGRALAVAGLTPYRGWAKPVFYRTDDGRAEVLLPGKPYRHTTTNTIYYVQTPEDGICVATLLVSPLPPGQRYLDTIRDPSHEIHCGPVRGVEHQEETNLGSAGVYTRIFQEYVSRGFLYRLEVGFLGRNPPEAARKCLQSFKVRP